MAERASSRQYLVVDEQGKGHLPVRDSAEGPLNHHLMGAAWAALHGGYRGQKYEGPGKQAALAKLEALYRAEGMELPEAQAENSRFQIQNSGAAGGNFRLPSGNRGSTWRDRPAPIGKCESAIDDAQSTIDQRPATIVNRQSAIDHPAGPRFVMTLAEPPGTGLLRIPIAVTGKWKGAEKEFAIGLDDLKEIRANFAKKPTHEINVDYEHASEVPFGTGGPVLSAGRIVRLDEPEKYANGSGQMSSGQSEPKPSAHLPTSPSARFILWGWYEPTKRARQLIAAKEYRYISPAIRWGARDKVSGKTAGTVLASVALVNKPFLEEMPEIHLCELDGTPAFVSLGQLHIPEPVNQESLSEKEKEMAKTLKLKCLTDEHLEQHDLAPEMKGQIGVFDGEELIGIADGLDGLESRPGSGDAEDGKKLAQLLATEIGLPGVSVAEIAALVKRGTEAPQDQYAALSESIHDGRINLQEAGKLADAGRVRFATILRAQEAERRVEAAVKAGKVLPKHRAHALKLALSDATAFSALVEQARPMVDVRSHGHAGGGEQPTAQQALMAEVNAYAKERRCSVSVALSEVTRLNPDLWREYSEEIVTAVESENEEEE